MNIGLSVLAASNWQVISRNICSSKSQNAGATDNFGPLNSYETWNVPGAPVDYSSITQSGSIPPKKVFFNSNTQNSFVCSNLHAYGGDSYNLDITTVMKTTGCSASNLSNDTLTLSQHDDLAQPLWQHSATTIDCTLQNNKRPFSAPTLSNNHVSGGRETVPIRTVTPTGRNVFENVDCCEQSSPLKRHCRHFFSDSFCALTSAPNSAGTNLECQTANTELSDPYSLYWKQQSALDNNNHGIDTYCSDDTLNFTMPLSKAYDDNLRWSSNTVGLEMAENISAPLDLRSSSHFSLKDNAIGSTKVFLNSFNINHQGVSETRNEGTLGQIHILGDNEERVKYCHNIFDDSSVAVVNTNKSNSVPHEDGLYAFATSTRTETQIAKSGSNNKRKLATLDQKQMRSTQEIPGVYFDRRKKGFRVRFQNVYVGWVSLSRYASYEDAYTVAKQIWDDAFQEATTHQDKQAALNAGIPLKIQSRLKPKNPGGRPRTVSRLDPLVDAKISAAVQRAKYSLNTRLNFP